MLESLRFMAAQDLDLILTSGGLGPTADDLTAEVVGTSRDARWCSTRPWRGVSPRSCARSPNAGPTSISRRCAQGNRKQATIPRRQRDPRARRHRTRACRPPPGDSGPTVVVLPGPPRELQPMWQAAVGQPELRRALADATVYEQHMLRLYGIPESEIAETLRAAEREGVKLDRLEITTCLKRGEVEVVTRYEPGAEGTYEAVRALRARAPHGHAVLRRREHRG